MGIGETSVRLGLLLSVAILTGCGSDEAARDAVDDRAEIAETDGDGITTSTEIGDTTVELTTQQALASIPLGLPPLPDAVVGYEMDRGSGDAIDYSGSFNTQMEPDAALGFYVDAITEQGGAFDHDGRGSGEEFQSIQGTMESGEEFYISTADLRDGKGYVQLDLKLKTK